MFLHESYGVGCKRNREEESDSNTLGFESHRHPKRHMSALPLRQSPEIKRRKFQTLYTQHQPKSPSLADITPGGSDSEDGPKHMEPKSFFSPWSSSPELLSQPSTQGSPCPVAVHSSEIQESAYYSDDLEMTDNNLLFPGPFHSETSTSIVGRIPTPIHPEFASHIRLVTGPPSDDHGLAISIHHTDNQLDRRLPSPISEDEGTSGMPFESSISMHMDIEVEERRQSPKRGHVRSKHCLRNWGGPMVDTNGAGVKKFSMGFRSDCEKCQKKVPGHFSHIITYQEDRGYGLHGI